MNHGVINIEKYRTEKEIEPIIGQMAAGPSGRRSCPTRRADDSGCRGTADESQPGGPSRNCPPCLARGARRFLEALPAWTQRALGTMQMRVSGFEGAKCGWSDKERDGLAVNLRQVAKFDWIYPALPQFNFADKGLIPTEAASDLHLSQASLLASDSQFLRKLLVLVGKG